MKDCLIIGNKNATTAKYVFPLIKDRILVIGYTIPTDYDQPEYAEPKSLQGLTRWFSTLSVSGKEPLILTATYDPALYPKYDNYDAIEVSRIKDIPYDYDGVMGVPITILEYDLDNVEIVDARNYTDDARLKKKGTPLIKDGDGTIKGKTKYCRVLIKKNFEIVGCCEPAINLDTLKEQEGFTEHKSRQIYVNGILCQKTYHRIFIKQK